MTLNEIANALAQHCRNGTEREALKTLYADHAVSVEATPMPGTDTQVSEGKQGITGKHDYWENAMEPIEITVGGPYPHEPNKFALTFKGTAKVKETGEPFPMDEVAVYTVEDGKIVREEFFYSMEP